MRVIPRSILITSLRVFSLLSGLLQLTDLKISGKFACSPQMTWTVDCLRMSSRGWHSVRTRPRGNIEANSVGGRPSED